MSYQPSRRSATTLLVVAVAMLGPLDTPPLGPALPAIAEQFSLSPARASLVISAYAATGTLFAPVVGSLADRHGRRRVLVPCLVGYGLAGLAVALAPNFATVLALRAVQGVVGGSILTSLAYTVVGDLFEGSARTGAMGLATAGASLTAAVGPALGGALAAEAWNGPFVLYGASLLVGVAVLLWLPEPSTAGGTERPTAADTELASAEADGATDGGIRTYLGDAVRSVPTRSALVAYGACLLGYTLFFGGVLTAVTFLLDGRFGLDTAAIGVFVTGATVVTAVVAMLSGRIARVAPAETLLPVGILLEGVGLGVAGLSGWVGTDDFVGGGAAVGSASASALAVLASGLVIFGAGYGIFQPALASVLARLGPQRARGGVMSLRTSVLLGGQAVSAPLFTLPAVAVGYDGILLAAGVAGVVGAGGLWVHRRPTNVPI